MAILDIENMHVDFKTPTGNVRVINDFSMRIDANEVHAIIGESGSGKTIIAHAIMGLLPSNATMTASYIAIDGVDLLGLSQAERRRRLGKFISMTFQDSSNSLTPTMTIGQQIFETLRVHYNDSTRLCRQRTRELLKSIGITDVEPILGRYPHQLGVGLRQRIALALAIASRPRILIADEPATALDVTTQTQVLALLKQFYTETEASLLIITHHFALISEYSHKLTLIYSGQVIESGPTDALIQRPHHPYTQAIIQSLPQSVSEHKGLIPVLPGSSPSINHLPVGCKLGPRCPYAEKQCVIDPPLVHDGSRYYRCHFPLNMSQTITPGIDKS